MQKKKLEKTQEADRIGVRPQSSATNLNDRTKIQVYLNLNTTV